MNEQNLKPFKKDDPRINRTGLNKGHFSLTRAVKEYLLEQSHDGETYGDKLKKAAVLRAIGKSDVLMKEIWDRTDGKVVTPIEHSGELKSYVINRGGLLPGPVSGLAPTDSEPMGAEPVQDIVSGTEEPQDNIPNQ